MIIWIIMAFLLGFFVQRIIIARHKGFTKLGSSWKLNNNKIYRWLHRVYCECCPRRLYCEEYKKRIKK